MKQPKDTPVDALKPKRRAKAEGNGKVVTSLSPASISKQEVIDVVQNTVAQMLTILPRGLHLDEIQPRAGLIHQAVISIMEGIGPIAKRHAHEEEGFNFRLIDEITGGLQPLMIQHKVYPIPRVLEHTAVDRRTHTGNLMVSSVVKVAFKLCCALDGSTTEEAITMGEAISDSSFSTNAAQTMALKQFLWQMFVIPVMNSDDPEGQTVPELAATETPIAPKTSYTETEREDRQPDLFSITQPAAQVDGGASKRRKKRDEQSAEPAPRRIVEEAPVSKGSIAIMRAHLSSKPGVTEKIVCANFQISAMEELKQSQLNDVKNFIDTYQPSVETESEAS